MSATDAVVYQAALDSASDQHLFLLVHGIFFRVAKLHYCHNVGTVAVALKALLITGDLLLA